MTTHIHVQRRALEGRSSIRVTDTPTDDAFTRIAVAGAGAYSAMADTTTGDAAAATDDTACTSSAVTDTATRDASTAMARTASAMTATTHTSTAVATTTRPTRGSAAGAATAATTATMCVRLVERPHGQRE
jgi:hypothetical protein